MKKERKKSYKLLILFAVLIAALAANVFVSVLFTKVERVRIDTNKLTSGKSIKLLQISDVHNKKSMSSNRQLLKIAEQEKPDIIAITGDFIDDNTVKLENVYALAEKLAAINQNTYFVTGNHEWRGGLAGELTKGLEQRGVKVLDNKNAAINIDGVIIQLCGVADWTSQQQDLYTALKGIDQAEYTAMLAHDPWIVYSYEKYVPDLTLSGHTHGGQIRMPVVGAIVAPNQKLFPELDKGIYKLKENKFLYIDSGVGTSALPIRFLNQSQVSVITIE